MIPYRYQRHPAKIIYKEKGKANIYGQRSTDGERTIILQGEHIKPATYTKTVLILMHPSGRLNLLPFVHALARAGIHILTFGSRYCGNDSMLILEDCIKDLEQVVRHARTTLGYEKVVLSGWSGGGPLAAMYQAEAELKGGGMLSANALLLIASHHGRAATLTEWLDPSYQLCDETQGRLPNFNIWTNPKTSSFLTRFKKAQIERNHRITNYVLKRLDSLGGEDRGLLIEGTMANPFFESHPEGGFMGDTRWMNTAPHGLARFTTLKSWLSQWSLSHSKGDALRLLPNISIPSLVIVNELDNATPPKTSKRLYEVIQSTQKCIYEIKGANHYYEGQPQLAAEAASITAKFLTDCGLLNIQSGPVHMGLNHVALVCSDLERTTDFMVSKLGMPLVKSINLPNSGKHVFFDAGNGSYCAYFWYANNSQAKRHRDIAMFTKPGVSFDDFKSASGAMDHIAWSMPTERGIKAYRKLLQSRGVDCSPLLRHADTMTGFSRDPSKTTFLSFYFFDPDGIMFEVTYTPVADLSKL